MTPTEAMGAGEVLTPVAVICMWLRDCVAQDSEQTNMAIHAARLLESESKRADEAVDEVRRLNARLVQQREEHGQVDDHADHRGGDAGQWRGLIDLRHRGFAGARLRGRCAAG